MHAKGDEYICSRKVIKHKTTGPSNNFAEGDVTNIAVNESGAGWTAQWLTNQSLDSLVITRPAFLQIKVRSVTGAMGQEKLNRDPISSLAFDLGNESRQRIAEPHFSALDQNHDARSCGHNFRQACQIENSICRHG